MIVDPKGGAHDVRRFSTRQDAASKNPDHVADGRFASLLRVFFGDFLCDKESYPRVSAEALQLFFDGYRYAQPILPCSRLRHSPFGPASPFAPQAAQCDKESLTRQRGSSAVVFRWVSLRSTHPTWLRNRLTD